MTTTRLAWLTQPVGVASQRESWFHLEVRCVVIERAKRAGGGVALRAIPEDFRPCPHCSEAEVVGYACVENGRGRRIYLSAMVGPATGDVIVERLGGELVNVADRIVWSGFAGQATAAALARILRAVRVVGVAQPPRPAQLAMLWTLLDSGENCDARSDAEIRDLYEAAGILATGY